MKHLDHAGDHAARQRDVLGAPLRVAPLTQAEIGPEAWGLADGIAATLGVEFPTELTTYFALMSRHPALYRCQLETGMMFFTHSAFSPRLRELAVLRTAWLAGAPYEWSEHIAIARRHGITPAETDRLREGAAAPGWTGDERALLAAVDELFERRMVSDALWAELEKWFDARQLIELPALVGQYLAVAMIQNTLRVPLTPDRNGFADR